MRPLRVRAYNIEFGDAILVSVPETEDGNEVYRHILIDVGNKGTDECSDLYEPVVKDVVNELNGQSLDLYVVTHEHMDHLKGLPYSEKHTFKNEENELRDTLDVKATWFPISSKPDYYDAPEHGFAKEKFLEIQSSLTQIYAYLNALQALGEPMDPYLEILWAINDLRKKKDCVDYLKTYNNPHYVYRGFDADALNLFSEATIDIWAPETDVGLYFKAFSPQPMNLEDIRISVAPSQRAVEGVPLKPPRGVDAGAFYNLVDSRKRFYENLLAANSSLNNTSIVFCLNWRGNRLLFTGDAQEASWEVMHDAGVLEKVDFLKISHHGAENGTPELEILDQIFPNDDVNRSALVSTIRGPHETIPHKDTLELIEGRCEKFFRLDMEPDRGEYQDIFFQPKH